MSDSKKYQPVGLNSSSLKIEAIRRRFLESVAGVLLVLAAVGLPMSLSRIINTGFHFNHATHIWGSLLVFALFLGRKRLSYSWLLFGIIGILTLLSISAFIQYGVVSAGFYFAGASIFITAVSLGLWSGMICAGFYAVLAGIIAYLWMSGQLVFPSDVREYILLPSVWATLAISFLITTAIFYVSAAGLFQGMRRLVDKVDKQNRELEAALKEIKTLHGLLPICASCKKIRDDKGYWQQLEEYLGDHTQAEFTHGLCPDCMKELYPELKGPFNGQASEPNHDSDPA
jgi:hypothetical protein